jgi:hypothetical protein
MHRDVVAGGPLPSQLRNIAMSGWANVTGAHAIAATFAGDPERAIAAAVGSGGDTDTVGSIVGAIVGARYGLNALPRPWVGGFTGAGVGGERDSGMLCGIGPTRITGVLLQQMPARAARKRDAGHAGS